MTTFTYRSPSYLFSGEGDGYVASGSLTVDVEEWLCMAYYTIHALANRLK
jgi:hypothetical protein